MSTLSPEKPAAHQSHAQQPLERVAAETDWEALTPNNWYARKGRRCFDLALLVACMPIFLVPGLLITLALAVSTRSWKKIFYMQDRVGLHGKIFRIYKFRTMRDVAESNLSSWSSGRDQDRVTTFGRILRSSHLDELPQLLNVLKGDMRFIGPRPEMVEIESWAVGVVPGFMNRLSIRPGITGFAQITQGYTSRSAAAYQRKLDLCLSYNESISLGVDLNILWQTFFWMMRQKGWQWQATDNRLARTAFRVLSEHEAPQEFGHEAPEPEPPLPAPARGSSRPTATPPVEMPRSEEC